jgi:prepilin-type N-terminal cleavage/methylation domain-containing protein
MNLIKKQGGFTIVELLVVIVVISILVALTLPNLFGLQRRARDDTRKNDLKNVKSALEEYYSDHNAYPAALTDLSGFTVPNDPQAPTKTYTYAAAPAGCATAADDCTSYTLTADLENDDDPLADGSGNYVVTSVNQ